MSQEAKQQRSYWVKSGLLTILQRLSVLIFGLGSLFLMLRGMSKEDFGTWALFLAVVSFLEVGRNGLIQNALVRFIAACGQENEEEYRKISTASLVINISLTIFSMVLLVVAAKPLSQLWNAPILMQMFPVYAITTAFLLPFFHFNCIQQANFTFTGIFWSSFVKQGLFFVYVLFAYSSGMGLTLMNLCLVQIVTAILGTATSYMFALPYIKFSKKVDWHWVRRLFNYGKFVFGTNLSAMLYKSIDKVMLGFVSPAFVAVYDLAIRINNLIEVPTFSIATIVFPKGAQQMKTEGKPAMKRLYEKSVGTILALILPCVLFILLFPELIITILAGEKYLDAVGILQLTVIYGLFIPFANQFGTVLDAMGKPKINFRFVILGAALNIASNYTFIFIFQYGLIGAAYGTLCTYGIMFVLNQWVLYKELNVNVLNVFPNIIKTYVEGFKMVQEFYFKYTQNNANKTPNNLPTHTTNSTTRTSKPLLPNREATA
ncbi:MAG: flippase [Chitinophagales bacterium]